ncbi:MAG: transcriptional regulator [Acidimicrobiia bacterium]|nr:transcriptional regulator [Acidimicrobiia bacterium]
MTDVAAAARAALLGIRLRPTIDLVGLDALLGSMSIPVDELITLVGRLEVAGLVERRGETAPGWRLTADGRHEGERLLAAELDERVIGTSVTRCYEQFVAQNGPLLHACTDWQLRDPTPGALVVNDHSDREYDRAVIDRLVDVHNAVSPVCDELAQLLPRFAGYRPRFDDAMRRIEGGDLGSLDTPPAVDKVSVAMDHAESYHSIWFELHEHLIATVGADRAAEPLP